MSLYQNQQSIKSKSCAVCSGTMALTMKQTVEENNQKLELIRHVCNACGYKEEDKRVIPNKKVLYS